ncbi:MAG: lysophospholipid acyltransferase family protein [Planctomycetota bacterium]
MQFNSPLITGAVSLPLALGVRAWMTTLNYRVLYRDPSVDVALHAGVPRIYLFWHDSILLPLHLRGNCNVAMLLSQHRDADFLAKIAGRFGFECVRGSTNRGGVRALREMARRGRSTHLAITPDGPRGPRRVCAAGPIFLASRLQMPIVAMGFGYQRPWRLRSWDRFAVPRPFSRARAVLSRPILVPPALGRDGIEDYRVRVEQSLTELADEAQAWADSGERRDGAQPISRTKAAPPMLPQKFSAAA